VAKDVGLAMVVMKHILRSRLKNEVSLRVDDTVENEVFWLAYERLRPAADLYALVYKMREIRGL
jgi:hypothetical protein